MKLAFVLALFSFFMAVPASAQFAATQDAQYIATLRAVLNYKIDDEENIRNIEKLREDKWFNQKLTRMLDKLQNTRSKNATNRRVYDILIKAGAIFIANSIKYCLIKKWYISTIDFKFKRAFSWNTITPPPPAALR